MPIVKQNTWIMFKIQNVFLSFVVIVLVNPAITLARVKPASEKECFDLAACVLTGTFQNITPIRIANRETRPISTSVGTFKIAKRVKTKSPLCMEPFDEIDVFMGTGQLTVPKGMGVGMEMNVTSPKNDKSYTVYLNSCDVIGPACSEWFRTLKN